MAASTHGKYTLRRRASLPDYELFQADFDSDIDSEVEEEDSIYVESSHNSFTEEIPVDFDEQPTDIADEI